MDFFLTVVKKRHITAVWRLNTNADEKITVLFISFKDFKVPPPALGAPHTGHHAQEHPVGYCIILWFISKCMNSTVDWIVTVARRLSYGWFNTGWVHISKSPLHICCVWNICTITALHFYKLLIWSYVLPHPGWVSLFSPLFDVLILIQLKLQLVTTTASSRTLPTKTKGIFANSVQEIMRSYIGHTVPSLLTYQSNSSLHHCRLCWLAITCHVYPTR